VSNTVRSPGTINGFLWAIVLSGFIETGRSVGVAMLSPRALLTTAGFPQPQAILILTLYLVYAPACWAPGRRKLRLLLYLGIAVLLGFLLASPKKASVVALAPAALVALLPALRPSRLRKSALALLVSLALILGGLALIAPRLARVQVWRYSSTVALSHISAFSRVEQIRISWRVFRAHPLLGVGAGDSLSDASHFQHDSADKLFYAHVDPHDWYLYMLASLGIPGALLLLVLHIQGYRVLLRLPTGPQHDFLRATLIGLWSFFIIFHLFDPMAAHHRTYLGLLLAVMGQASLLLAPSAQRSGRTSSTAP
jgi:hypothetical protein